MHSAGGVEANGLFRTTSGDPRWGKMFAFKAGSCAMAIVFQETNLMRRHESAPATWAAIGINSIHAAVYTGASIHNFKLANDLRSQPGRPR